MTYNGKSYGSRFSGRLSECLEANKSAFGSTKSGEDILCFSVATASTV